MRNIVIAFALLLPAAAPAAPLPTEPPAPAEMKDSKADKERKKREAEEKRKREEYDRERARVYREWARDCYPNEVIEDGSNYRCGPNPR